MNEEQKLAIHRVVSTWWADGPYFPTPWHRVGPLKFYLRKGPVFVSEVRYNSALTIASIEVRSSHQKMGFCRELFLAAEKQNADILTVESVLSCRMENILVANGWRCYDNGARCWAKDRSEK